MPTLSHVHQLFSAETCHAYLRALRCGVSADRLYGFERFILQKIGGDVLSLNADVDEPYGLLSRAVRGAAGTGGINA
jgi:hypothetical protein